MKLLFLFHEYGDRRWFQYTSALERLGHQVEVVLLRNKFEPDQVSVDQLAADYQAIWINSAEYLWSGAVGDDFLQAARERRMALVGYVTLKANVPLADWFGLYRKFDLCLVHSKELTHRARAYGLDHVHHLPYGFDPHSYYSCEVAKDITISFAGNPEQGKPIEEDRRVRVINVLKPFKIRVFGVGFAGRLDAGIQVRPFSTNREMNEIYNRSAINLDIPCVTSTIPEIEDFYHPKFRLFDVPGSGNFLLSGYAPEFDEAFPERVCAAYYRNPDELCASVEYYLTHESQRREIERQAHHHAHQNHRQEIHLAKAMTRIEKTIAECRS